MQTDLILKTLNISNTELQIYKTLNKFGPQTVLQLSQSLNVPRSTIHSNVEKLLEKEIINKQLFQNKWKFVAVSPAVFEKMLDNEAFELQDKKDKVVALKSILPEFINSFELSPITNAASNSNISIYEGKKGILRVYKQIVESKKLRSYPNAYWVTQLIPSVPLLFQERLNNSEFESWDLYVHGMSAEHTTKILSTAKNYHFKYLPSSINQLEIDYSIFDNKIAIFTNNPYPQVVVIEDELQFNHAAKIFDLLWELLP